MGTYVLGMGFTLTPDERDALIKKSKRNAERIFPYIGGEEVNTSPTQAFDRYVINFGDMSLEEAEKWPDLIAIVRDKVKPERDKNNREVRRKYWWRFGETAPALYAAISGLDRCLVNSQVTKHLVFAWQSTDRVFGHTLYAYALTKDAAFATLQSRVHEGWARLLSSSMKSDLRYAASDCFANFPFPQPDPRTTIPELERIGEQLYTARAKYMVDTDQGLTKTYNALKDSKCRDAAIISLRALHEDMDRGVLAAYGWSDIEVPPFDQADQVAFSNEVTDRLYDLNQERASNERRQLDLPFANAPI